MSKPIIHFAHANGFPAKTYSKLFSFLESEYQINYLERHAHNPKFPVTDGWDRLRDELREELERRYTDRVIGIGHSLGGVLHLLVAAEKPEFYERIILLDAPIISRFSSLMLRLIKTFNLTDKYTPAQITRFRRSSWKSKDEVFQHFKTKAKFDAFDEDVLRDYAEHATFDGEANRELFFKPSIEAKIYQTLPHHLPRLKGKLKIPISYIGGANSREAELARLSFMRKNFAVDFHEINGSHLFPLENPLETAEIIKKILHV